MDTNKKILFCDMDGTLARFYEPDNCLERFLHEADYFEKLRPYENLVKAIVRLMHDGIIVVILSSVDSSIKESCEKQKNKWLEKVFCEYGSEAPPALYPQNGQSKREYVKSVYGDLDTAVLLDDYTKNLMDWDGQSIKALNEINGYGGKFEGLRIDVDKSTEEEIYQTLLAVLSKADTHS